MQVEIFMHIFTLKSVWTSLYGQEQKLFVKHSLALSGTHVGGEPLVTCQKKQKYWKNVTT